MDIDHSTISILQNKNNVLSDIDHSTVWALDFHILHFDYISSKEKGERKREKRVCILCPFQWESRNRRGTRKREWDNSKLGMETDEIDRIFQ